MLALPEGEGARRGREGARPGSRWRGNPARPSKEDCPAAVWPWFAAVAASRRGHGAGLRGGARGGGDRGGGRGGTGGGVGEEAAVVASWKTDRVVEPSRRLLRRSFGGPSANRVAAQPARQCCCLW
jgi:hypothetical protein